MNKPKLRPEKTKLQQITEKHGEAAKKEIKELGVFLMLAWPMPDAIDDNPEATLQTNVDLKDRRSVQHLVFHIRALADRLDRLP